MTAWPSRTVLRHPQSAAPLERISRFVVRADLDLGADVQ
jgi:hypothetical protein